MIALYVFAGSAVSGILMLLLLKGVLRSEGLQRTNFRDVRLPTSAGVLFPMAFLPVWLVITDHVARHAGDDGRLMTTYNHSLRFGFEVMLVLVLGFCLLGLLDDMAGGSSEKGFRGHFSAAMKGKFTTGLVKAFLGFVVALVALYSLMPLSGLFTWQAYGTWLINAAVIALSANFFNLLDLRPGRALKVFFPALGLCAALTLRYEGLPLVPYQPLYAYVTPALSIAAIALVLLPGDLRERFMMGDAGANVTGAVIGLGLVLGTSFWWRLGVLALLLALNAISERWSFTDIIHSNRILSWLDLLGTKGRKADETNNT